MELEHYEQSKEGGIRFVEDVFVSMGGKVLPPRRPGHVDPRNACYLLAREDFYLDFENACLSQHWDSSKRRHPKGKKRHEDPEWAAMIQGQVYPHHSDIDWQEYVDFVNHGGGDDCFQEDDVNEDGFFNDDVFWFDAIMAARDEQEFMPGYLEAQTRLRTAYACKEMVRPLSTPLDHRIVAMAAIVNQGEDEPEVKAEKRQCIRDTRCSGCGRGDDFCRCGGDNSIWWG